MVKYKYGEFGEMQFEDAIRFIRKKIFFLLLIVDEETKWKYDDVDVEAAFEDIFYLIDGFNEILYEPKEVVTAISLLHSALVEYMNPEFKYEVYRKLVLDAGNEIKKVGEVTPYADT